MPWFRVDDTLSSHPKARSAGLPAMGLWTVCGAYASQYLTEGYVPDWFVASWPQGKKLAAALVTAGLWEEAEGGWQFHQWDERQPTKEQVEADREATRERQQRWRDAKRAKAAERAVTNGVSNAVTDAVSNGVTNGVTNASPSLPGPTLPSSSIEAPKPRKRATQIPKDWTPSTDDVTWQRDEGVSNFIARRELPIFIDHWTSKGEARADWSATWRNWLRRAGSFTNGRAAVPESKYPRASTEW